VILYALGMAARHERIVWTETAIRRLAAARADGIPAAELALRFGVTRATVARKLAELRTLDETRPLEWLRRYY
jgi:hypothetical protein